MVYIVYITDNCLQEAKKHSFEQDLIRLKEKTQKTQSISYLERFGSSNFLKKGLGKHGRLIAYEYNDVNPAAGKNYTVIIFLTIFIRADKNYDTFRNNIETQGEKLLNKLNKNDLETYVKKTVSSEPKPSSNPLTEDESSYLYSSSVTDYDLNNEEMVYESEEWVKTINQEKFSLILHRIYETVQEIIKQKQENGNEFTVQKNTEIIIFDYNKNERRLSLIDLVTAESYKTTHIEDTVKSWKQNLDKNISIVKRAYPQYILADEKLWMAIEKDPQSNFTLSKEEIDVLDACSKNSVFPLFINGRAGSGKSTMLQYLYADYFSRYISYKDTLKNPPVYFTYNSALSQRAKVFVKGLITCNSAFESEREKLSQNELNARLDGSFKELKTYLLDILPQEEKAKFNPTNYVSYTGFRSLWMKKFGRDQFSFRDYSPDLSWHVIRTYIQGMDADRLFDPEDYDDIDEKQETVSKQDFQTIYDKVWKWYLEEIKQENKLWDDQDLGRYILEHNLAEPSFPGIFCDEAQDFTRVEMELLFRLSYYSNKDIKRQDISKIPFAFAGDEFQTLNPTGFRWEALKAGFTQKFLLPLSAGTRGAEKIELNYRVLENNYRSMPEIVKFCNTLQLFRAVRFNFPGLRPQKYWKSQSSTPVASFHSDDTEFWEKILKLTDTVFIIPCDEGQEVAWIEKDNELKRYITIDNNAPANMSVLSANLAKGLEFNNVVVYKFGSHCPPKMIKGGANEDKSDRLPLEYYINKAYVAVSRAKKRLFIVDTQEGMHNLWDVTINKELIDSNLEKINEGNTEPWSLDKDLFLLIPGFYSLLENFETNDEENASQFWQRGISNRQSYPLRLAMPIYRKLEKYIEANKCEAAALLFDKDYIQAGIKYADSGFRNEAIKAFWLADSIEGYENIVQRAKQNPDYKFMYSIAMAMIKNEKNVLVDAIKIVFETSKDTLLSHILKGDDIFPVLDLHNILPKAVNEIVQKIRTYIDPSTDELLLHQIMEISKRGIKINPSYIAEIAYTLNEYEKAVEYWDKSETKDNEKYITAKIFTAKFPENLPLLKSIKRYDEITNQYSVNKNKKLSEEHLCIAAEAFLYQKDPENALQICERLTSQVSINQLEKCYAAVGNDKAIQNIFYILARICKIREEDWDKILSLFKEEETEIKTNMPLAVYYAAAIARLDSMLLPAVQKDISKILRTEIVEKSLIIPDELVLDVGTAVEKAGHWVDALTYYEFAEAAVKTPELKRKCAERWIKAKERHAKITPENDSVTRDKRINEALNKRKAYDIPEKPELPDYEELTEWTDLYRFIIKNESIIKKQESTEKPKTVTGSKRVKVVPIERPSVKNEASEIHQPQSSIEEIIMNGYKFEYYNQLKRLSITNMADGNNIKIMKANYSSADYTVEEVIYKNEKYYSIKDTSILFQNTDKILVKFSDTGSATLNFDI